jgi:hypothetical protein
VFEVNTVTMLIYYGLYSFMMTWSRSQQQQNFILSTPVHTEMQLPVFLMNNVKNIQT